MKRTRWILNLTGILAGFGLLSTLVAVGSLGQSNSHTFTETGHTVSGVFWTYWQGHGGLAQQGYPISDEFTETSALNGKPYTVQYFERAVFEKHPENASPFNVLLSQLGTFRYKQKYPNGAPNQHISTVNPRVFSETHHTIGGDFRTYWEGHGGLAQQGYPISDEFTETSELNGKPYTVQYFERAVFEKHPENAPPFNVLLSQLGTFRYKALYGSGAVATPTPAPGTANATEFDFDFSPKTLTVPVGTKVIWTNRGPTEHTVADRAGSFGSDPLHPGDSYSHVFTTPGTYAIHCTLHAFMDMTVIVK